jgi:hypothetical protein
MLQASRVGRGGRGDIPQALDGTPLLGLVHGLDGRDQALAEAVGKEVVEVVVKSWN